MEEVKKQGKEDESKLKTKLQIAEFDNTILRIDKFVKALVDRLKNPNETGFFSKSPAPLAADDTLADFNACIKVIKSNIGNVLTYRSIIPLKVPAPVEYSELKSILDKELVTSAPKDTFTDSRPLEFLYRFKLFMLKLSSGSEKIPECKKYPRIKSLFNDASDKAGIDYKQLYTQLINLMKNVETPKFQAEVDRQKNMVMAARDVDIRYQVGKEAANIPTASSTTTSSTSQDESQTIANYQKRLESLRPSEPSPNVSQAEIDSELSTTSTTTSSSQPKKPLTSFDKMKIAGIAAQISKDPRTAQRQLSMAQIQEMAENIYRRKTGMGRKTYKKKINRRKTRKVRRV